MDSSDYLKDLGWRLSSEGLASCRELCKEKGLALSGKSMSKAALDLDLRGIGDPCLPKAPGTHTTLKGPLVLQVQKVKNVAVSSGKQHDASPSKRLLRLGLTDGHVNIGAVEIDGAIAALSPVTPPGTKVRLTGSVSVVNGFILLKKSSTEVLGGHVEVLLKKWNMNKALPDNLERDRGGGENGPPQFVKFSKMQKVGVKPRIKEPGAKKERASSPSSEPAPSRELMELPAAYREERAAKKAAKEASDIEDLVRPHEDGRGHGQRDLRRTQEGFRGRDGGPPGVQGRGERSSDVRFGGRGVDDQVSERRGRGRGRGRGRRDREEEDDYYPQKRKETYQLFDFIQRPEQGSETKKQQQKDDNVLDDYYYDVVADQYIPKVSHTSESYSHQQGQARYGSDFRTMDENMRTGRRQEGGRGGDSRERSEYRKGGGGGGGGGYQHRGDYGNRSEERKHREYSAEYSSGRGKKDSSRSDGSGGRQEYEGRERGRADIGRGQSGSSYSGERSSSSYDSRSNKGYDEGRDRSNFSRGRDKGGHFEGQSKSDRGGIRDGSDRYSSGRGGEKYERGRGDHDSRGRGDHDSRGRADHDSRGRGDHDSRGRAEHDSRGRVYHDKGASRGQEEQHRWERGRNDYGGDRHKSSYGVGRGYDGGQSKSGYGGSGGHHGNSGHHGGSGGHHGGRDGGGKQEEVGTKQHVQDTQSYDWSHLTQSCSAPSRARKIE